MGMFSFVRSRVNSGKGRRAIVVLDWVLDILSGSESDASSTLEGSK